MFNLKYTGFSFSGFHFNSSLHSPQMYSWNERLYVMYKHTHTHIHTHTRTHTHTHTYTHTHTHTLTPFMSQKHTKTSSPHTKQFSILINQALSCINKRPGDQYWSETNSIINFDMVDWAHCSLPWFNELSMYALQPSLHGDHTVIHHCYRLT